MSSDVGLVPSRWVWASLTAEQAADLWAELYEWVEWVRARFEWGSKIPPCWFRHPPVVEALTAMMAGWVAVYHIPLPEPGQPDPWGWYRQEMVVFLNHELLPMVERIRTLSNFERCKPVPPDPWVCGHAPTPPKTDPTFGEVVLADVEARR